MQLLLHTFHSLHLQWGVAGAKAIYALRLSQCCVVLDLNDKAG